MIYTVESGSRNDAHTAKKPLDAAVHGLVRLAICPQSLALKFTVAFLADPFFSPGPVSHAHISKEVCHYLFEDLYKSCT